MHVSDLEENLRNEWNYLKNNDTFIIKNNVWWICSKNNKHEWQASVHCRIYQKSGCPFCSNKRACEENCLETLFPDIAKEWNYDKNLGLTPKDVLSKSHKKVWWKCNNGHEWLAIICDRTIKNTKCTQCNYGFIIRDKKDIYNYDKTKKYCKICNNLLDINDKNFRKHSNPKKGEYHNECRTCANNKIIHARSTTKSGIAANMVRQKRYVCKNKGIPFDLDKEWILKRLDDIGWRCELTGLPFNEIRVSAKDKRQGFGLDAISIDRIIPSDGYIKNNVRFVLNQVNIFRQNGSDERMYMIAEALLKYKGYKYE